MHPTASQAVCLMADAAVRAGWVEQDDRDYCVNQLLALMALDAPEQATGTLPMLDAADILYQDALSRGLVQPGNDARGFCGQPVWRGRRRRRWCGIPLHSFTRAALRPPIGSTACAGIRTTSKPATSRAMCATKAIRPPAGNHHQPVQA